MDAAKTAGQLEKISHRYTCEEIFPEPDFPLRVMPVSHPASFSAHSHDFAELVCVRSGQGIHRVLRAAGGPVFSYGIAFGDVFLLRPREIHSFLSCSGLNMYNLLFMPELLGEEAGELWELPGFSDENSRKGKLHLDSGERAAFEAHAARLSRELDERRPGYRIAARSILRELLVMTGRLRQTPWDSAASGSEFNSLHKQQLVNKTICIMETEFADTLPMPSLAERLRTSQSQLTRTFKAVCGLTPGEYLTRIRLEKAKAMLAETDLTVADVAFRSGFGDASYLSKLFRRLEGCTPGEYRAGVGR